jgi:hypothetical protein
MTKKQYRRFKVSAQSTWKKSAASIVAVCACRNFRQVVSVSRRGAGGIFKTLRIRRMAAALTRRPTFSSSPVAGDQAAVPAQDGAGGDHRYARSLAGLSRVSSARTCGLPS